MPAWITHLGCDQIPRCTMVGVWSEVQHKITEVFSRTTIAALKRSPCGEIIVGLFSFERGLTGMKLSVSKPYPNGRWLLWHMIKD